jgi:Family of unknown function (DUF6263)
VADDAPIWEKQGQEIPPRANYEGGFPAAFSRTGSSESWHMRSCTRTILAAFLACVLWPAWSGAQVVLRSDYSQPAEYRTTESVQIDQTLNIAEQSLATSSEQQFGMFYNVGEADAAGLIPLRLKFESVRASFGLPGGIHVEFDSKNDDGKDAEPPASLLKSAMRAMVGAELTAQVDRQGQVQSFTGGEQVLDKVAPEMKAMVASQVDEGILKSSLQTAIDRFPAEPVKPGDVWTRTRVMHLGQGQQLTFDERLEYVGTVDKDGRKLEHVHTQASAVRFNIADNSAMPFKLKGESDLKIESSSGDYYVDAPTRRVMSLNEKVRIQGKLVLVANDMEFPSTLDLTMVTTYAEGDEPVRAPAP